MKEPCLLLLCGTQGMGQARLPENDSPRGAERAAPAEATADQWAQPMGQQTAEHE